MAETKKTRKPKNQMMTREDAPDIVDKILSLLNKEVDNLSQKSALSSEDLKNVIAVAGVVTSIYKEYKLELRTLEQDIGKMTKAEISALVKKENV